MSVSVAVGHCYYQVNQSSLRTAFGHDYNVCTIISYWKQNAYNNNYYVEVYSDLAVSWLSAQIGTWYVTAVTLVIAYDYSAISQDFQICR